MINSPQKQLVLVVDDDTTMRLLACETLEQAGFTVEEAEDGRAGVAALAAASSNVPGAWGSKGYFEIVTTNLSA